MSAESTDGQCPKCGEEALCEWFYPYYEARGEGPARVAVLCLPYRAECDACGWTTPDPNAIFELMIVADPAI